MSNVKFDGICTWCKKTVALDPDDSCQECGRQALVKLSQEQNEELSNALHKLEIQTQRETGVYLVCGGFAKAELDYVEEGQAYVTLTWGTEDETGSDIHTEHYTYDFERREIEP